MDGANISYDKQMVWDVPTSEDVVWLYCYEICSQCIRALQRIQMVHRSMKNDSNMADKLYLKRGCLVLDDFMVLSLYSLSCIAKQPTTLKQLQPVCCFDSSIRTLSTLVLFQKLHYCLHYYLSLTLSITWIMSTRSGPIRILQIVESARAKSI